MTESNYFHNLSKNKYPQSTHNKMMFLTLTSSEREWWIYYWKITQSWDKYININNDPWLKTIDTHLKSGLKMLILFNDLHREKYDFWSTKNEVNYWLMESEQILNGHNIDWSNHKIKNKMIWNENFCGDAVQEG